MKKLLFIYSLLTSGMSLCPTDAAAQTPADSTTRLRHHALDEVVVTGTRNETDVRHLPMTVSVVGRQLLENSRETSILPILNAYLRRGPRGLWCEDSTDYALPVSPGDLLTVVARTKNGFLCKKDGVTGWYYGRLWDIM